jgi:hypothetical protein
MKIWTKVKQGAKNVGAAAWEFVGKILAGGAARE